MAGAGPPGNGPNPPLIGINNSAAFNRMIGSTPKKGTSVSFPRSEEFPSAHLSHDINKKVTNNAAPASTAAAAAAAAAEAADGNINLQYALDWFMFDQCSVSPSSLTGNKDARFERMTGSSSNSSYHS